MVLTEDERELRELSSALYKAMTSLPYMPQLARDCELLADLRIKRIARDKRIAGYRNAKP